MTSNMDNFKFTKKDFILYLLARIEPKRADLVCLNKLAFFTEFYFKYKTGNDLSDSNYAAIDYGPIINRYRDCLTEMETEGLVKLNEYKISLCSSADLTVPEEVQSLIDPIIEKYSQFNNRELISLSHDTDSYKITTDNEKIMGNIIDKNLASLETFFDSEELAEYSEDEVDELLPDIDLNDLKKKAHAVARK